MVNQESSYHVLDSTARGYLSQTVLFPFTVHLSKLHTLFTNHCGAHRSPKFEYPGIFSRDNIQQEKRVVDDQQVRAKNIPLSANSAAIATSCLQMILKMGMISDNLASQLTRTFSRT